MKLKKIIESKKGRFDIFYNTESELKDFGCYEYVCSLDNVSIEYVNAKGGANYYEIYDSNDNCIATFSEMQTEYIPFETENIKLTKVKYE